MATARDIAFRLLVDLEKKHSYSNIALDEALKRADMDERDRRFCTALFYGTLERLYTLDAIIADNLDKPADKLSAEIRTILRMGLYQLLYMDSVPDNAAVSESVALAKRGRNPAASGFVNAVLRSFIRKDKRLPKQRDRLHEMALEYSCPVWLVKKWHDEYGDNACESILKASLGKAPEYIRLNTLKADASEICGMLEQQGAEIRDLGGGSALISGTGSVERMEAYKKGLFHVQDISCQLCCQALDPQRGETVLDLCAAPGGKTFTIAELMKDEGRVLAFDLHENRARLIKSGAERLGLKSVEAGVNNAKVFNSELPMADRVLCDVPCSGLGVIRRKPEIKYKTREELERLPEIQLEILEASAGYVKPGGVLVYSTCSLSKAENEDVAEAFLARHPDFSPSPLGDAFGQRSKVTSITIFPDMYDSDGFFIAKFCRLR